MHAAIRYQFAVWNKRDLPSYQQMADYCISKHLYNVRCWTDAPEISYDKLKIENTFSVSILRLFL